jgi:hypothetical protein
VAGFSEAVAERAKNPKTLLDGPGPATKGEKVIAANGINRREIGSNNANYLTVRIARDHPDILDRMKAGEFASVRQAAIAAGIVKVKTAPEWVWHWWECLELRLRTPHPPG